MGNDLKADSSEVAEEQLVYANWLEHGARLAFIVLVASLAAYLSGGLALAVPLERLPALWGLSAAGFVAASGGRTGWGWLDLGSGEVALLGSVAYLLCISTLCLCWVLPIYARRRDWTYFVIALLEIGVLALAASGVFA